jgi:hypothetical protein
MLRLWVRIPPVAWMSVSYECCVLSGRGLCFGLITRPDESYRVWCVWVWSWILDNDGALAQWGGGVLSHHVKKNCWILIILYVRCISRKFPPTRVSFDVLISNNIGPYKAETNTYRHSMRREGRNKFLIAHFHSERPYPSHWSCSARIVYTTVLQLCKYPGFPKGAY